MLSSSGPSYGYFINPGKTWLIVKPQHERDAEELQESNFTVEKVECIVSINKQVSLSCCIMKDATH